MNFLAHAVLSFDDPEITVGNFIADFVKGNAYQQYPQGVRQGILLHREIDYFTDQHPVVRTSKERLYNEFHHYSGVIIDMFFDHFLAANFFKFHSSNLTCFAEQVYQIVGAQKQLLPFKAERVLHYMSRGNWLKSYSQIAGIEGALIGMSRRTKFDSRMEHAGLRLRADYKLFYTDFMMFFPSLVRFSSEKITL